MCFILFSICLPEKSREREMYFFCFIFKSKFNSFQLKWHRIKCVVFFFVFVLSYISSYRSLPSTALLHKKYLLRWKSCLWAKIKEVRWISEEIRIVPKSVNLISYAGNTTTSFGLLSNFNWFWMISRIERISAEVENVQWHRTNRKYWNFAFVVTGLKPLNWKGQGYFMLSYRVFLLLT